MRVWPDVQRIAGMSLSCLHSSSSAHVSVASSSSHIVTVVFSDLEAEVESF